MKGENSVFHIFESYNISTEMVKLQVCGAGQFRISLGEVVNSFPR